MANRIKIRRGNGIPTTSSLLPYELGWNTANKILYINDNNNAIEGIGLRYINTTDNTTWTADTLGATTSIAFTRTNITGAYTTGHIVWLNANDIGTPFQLVVHDSSDLYLYKRWKSSGTWQAWTKMRAGYADSAGSATSANALNFVHTNELILGNGTSPTSIWFNYRRVQNGATSGNTAITSYHFGNGNGGTTGVTLYASSLSGNAATASGLVDGSSTMTSAYNKAGLGYDNYTWLAGWNQYELRAVAKTQFAQASHTHSYLPLSGGTLTGNITSPSTNCSWISGQNATNAAFNVGDATNTGSYWPWMRQTNTSSAKWFSFGTLNTSFYWIGSATSRTANGYDYGMNFDIATGKLLVDGVAVIRDSGTTSRRIWVTTSSSYSSSYANGDIVLVKAS